MAKNRKSKVRGITSREYKLILSADRFAKRRKGTTALRDLVRRLAQGLGADLEDQDEEEIRRTFYLDTAAFQLRRAGYALRVRFEEAEGKFKIALKHRDPDRYLAASKHLSSPRPDDRKKFEEDILPPFRSVFSQSNSLKLKDLPKLEDLKDAEILFPGLGALGLPGKTELVRVNGFEAHEVFCKLCKVKFGKKPKVKVGLSFWYLTPEDRWPLIAECAFDYDADNGDDFPIHVVEGATRLFRALQGQPGWFNFDATTKTRYVYEGISSPGN